ncbi:conjugal transfer protein TraB, partial [Streptomyces benahoarensis]
MADSPKADLWKALKHPHTRPWLAVAAEVPATFAAHQAWGSSTIAAIGMTLASGALTAGTWWAAEGTRPARRIHATLTMAAAMTYTTTAIFTDPLGPEQLSTLVIGGSVAAGLWNVRKALRVNPDAK